MGPSGIAIWGTAGRSGLPGARASVCSHFTKVAKPLEGMSNCSLLPPTETIAFFAAPELVRQTIPEREQRRLAIANIDGDL